MNGHKHCACRRAIAGASRRFFLTGLAAAAISPAAAHAQAGGPASSEDVRFMRMALRRGPIASRLAEPLGGGRYVTSCRNQARSV